MKRKKNNAKERNQAEPGLPLPLPEKRRVTGRGHFSGPSVYLIDASESDYIGKWCPSCLARDTMKEATPKPITLLAGKWYICELSNCNHRRTRDRHFDLTEAVIENKKRGIMLRRLKRVFRRGVNGIS